MVNWCVTNLASESVLGEVPGQFPAAKIIDTKRFIMLFRRFCLHKLISNISLIYPLFACVDEAPVFQNVCGGVQPLKHPVIHRCHLEQEPTNPIDLLQNMSHGRQYSDRDVYMCAGLITSYLIYCITLHNDKMYVYISSYS